MSSSGQFKLFDFTQERVRVLHYTWVAFFLTFFVWFNMAPLKTAMVEAFDFLDGNNFKSLLLCNVALTIPARIVVGALIDKYGPRVIFSGLMVITVIPGLMFAFGDSFMQLVISRLLLSSIGAGFVIGIKMTANWFPAKHIGRAEGFYAGWGNFGSAAAAGLIPYIGLTIVQGEMGWRWAMAFSSIITCLYGFFYYFKVKDYPTGEEPSKTVKKGGVMPVSSYGDLAQYLLWTIPLYGALGLLAFNLQKQQIISETFKADEGAKIEASAFKNADVVKVMEPGGVVNFFEKGTKIKVYTDGKVVETYKKDESLEEVPFSEFAPVFKTADKVAVLKKGKEMLTFDGNKAVMKKFKAPIVKKEYKKGEIMSAYESAGVSGFFQDGSILKTFKFMFSKKIMYMIWLGLGLFYLYKAVRILQYNLPRLKAGVPEEEKYPYSSVGALNTTYFANFGAELAVVSMLPFFFEGTFGISPQMAGLVAGSFAVINLVARPLGGYLSDKMGSRKKTMLMYMVGISLGFFLMGFISKYTGQNNADGDPILAPMFDGSWWLVMSIIITMFASMFVQGAEGATFAMIPSIKKDMTGRIAGMAGAYGNVGAVTYLFILSMVDAKMFFFILAGGAAISFIVCALTLKEPEGSFGEVEEGAH
jgi:nitrate/nitrite transporter NarK